MAIALLLGAIAIVRIPEPGAMISMEASERETVISESLTGNGVLLTPFRIAGKVLGKRYFPENRLVIEEKGQIMKDSYYTDPEYAADRTKILYQFCRNKEMDFLYVIVPGKPLYDEELLSLGVSCRRNESASAGKKALRVRGVPVFDLRPEFRRNWDNDSLFYKTDHHWNTDAGVAAARLIANEINTRLDRNLSAGNLDEDKIGREVYQNAFVGEMGQDALGKYGGRDDFIRRFPMYDVHLRFLSGQRNIDETGGFEVLTDEARLEKRPIDEDDNLYYYYLFGNDCKDEIYNKDVSEGDILLIKDSYSNMVSPFLSLTCGHLTLWDMREDKNVTKWLEDHPETETVIVMYTVPYVTDSEMNDYH